VAGPRDVLPLTELPVTELPVTELPVTDRLAATAELVAVPSVSHHEQELADRVESRLRLVPGLTVDRVGDNVVARTTLGRHRRLVVAGHLDTVPPAEGNEVPRIEGDTLWGVGAADMKGGLAVMLELAAGITEPVCDLTLIFYVAEEVARAHNGLLALAATRPELLVADAAILCEPSGAIIEAGCQGVLKVAVTVGGQRAHTARPWMGRNAIHRLGPVLDRIAAYPGRSPEIDGCRYREALEAVAVSGGVAGNVVPDTATVTLSHRFAPDRDAAEAEANLRAFLADVLDPGLGDRLEVLDVSPAAAPSLGHPLLAGLLAATGTVPRAKLGWTDVAFFAERGVPAANFGPGDPELAHRADERVERASLDAAYGILARVLRG
jgi:succinyl-diaminopimelate desuccinylase